MATEPKYDREELVSVFDSMEESEVMVVRGLLESNGIECLVTALDAPQDVLPGSAEWWCACPPIAPWRRGR